MINIDFDKVEEPKEFKPLKVGPYVCKILRAVDVPDKQYLRIEFDIIYGEYKGYFQGLYDYSKAHVKEGDKEPKWRGTMYRSYKTEACPFFKKMLIAVGKCNEKFHWKSDENDLINKIVVVNFREEEYINLQGERAVVVKPFEFRSTEAYKVGRIKIAPLYTLEKQHIAAPESETPKETISKETDDILPF